MAHSIELEAFRGGLMTVLEELFETDRQYILDQNENMWATLAHIDAGTASETFASGMATIAAQVSHIEFLIDAILNHFGEHVDWSAAWNVGAVTDDEWADLTQRLRARYEELKAFASGNTNWDQMMIGGAFALVAHIAYHLGQIREALGVIWAIR